MITEKELLNAIKECEAEPITLSKVGKLADFYIIYDHLFGTSYHKASGYSESIETPIIQLKKSDTEFLKAVNGKKSEPIWQIMDELMETTKTLHPKMYQRVLEKISDI